MVPVVDENTTLVSNVIVSTTTASSNVSNVLKAIIIMIKHKLVEYIKMSCFSALFYDNNNTC